MPCDTPLLVTTKEANYDVPCGKCPVCIKNRVNGWVFRCMQEDKRSIASHFITLTYDTRHVPISPNGFMTLSPKVFPILKNGKRGKTKTCDLTKFFKRLRKLQPKVKLKYYAVGEYGGQTERPHYHAIVFNVTDEEFFVKAWDKGIVHVGSVTGDSVGYTAGYINKGSIVPKHKMDDRVKEFSVMSNDIGSNYLTKQIIAYHRADLSRNYVTLDGGVKVPLPKYYRDKIYDEVEREQQRFLIMESVAENEKQLEKEFNRKFGHRSDMDFFEYKSRMRYGRSKQWKAHQKFKRNKI